MKRLLIAPVLALALAGCETVKIGGLEIDRDEALGVAGAVVVAAAPSVLEAVNNSGFDPLQVSPEALPLYGAVCRIAADTANAHGYKLSVDGEKGCDFILKALAAAPIDPADELSPPVPVEKPADS